MQSYHLRPTSYNTTTYPKQTSYSFAIRPYSRLASPITSNLDIKTYFLNTQRSNSYTQTEFNTNIHPAHVQTHSPHKTPSSFKSRPRIQSNDFIVQISSFPPSHLLTLPLPTYQVGLPPTTSSAFSTQPCPTATIFTNSFNIPLRICTMESAPPSANISPYRWCRGRTSHHRSGFYLLRSLTFIASMAFLFHSSRFLYPISWCKSPRVI